MCLERYLFLSLLMDFAVLSAASRCLGIFRWTRVALASLIATVYGLLAALRPQPWRTPPIQLALLVILALEIRPRGLRCLTSIIPVLCGGMLFCGGFMTLLCRSSTFPDIPASCVCVVFLNGFMGIRRQALSTWTVTLRIMNNGRCTRFAALIDTGNRLTEPFSGQPVLIAEAPLVEAILPTDGWRQVAYGALNGSGTLSCFRADALWIETRHGPRRAADVWIAVMPRPLPGPTRALAPAELSLLI